jgi:hypothetical protein
MLSSSDEESPVLPFEIIDIIIKRLAYDRPYHPIIIKNINQRYYRKYRIKWQLNHFTLKEIAMKGYCSMLKWYYDMGYTQLIEECGMYMAAGAGHLDIIKWLLSIGRKITEDCVDFASHGGQVNVINWYVDNNYPASDYAAYSAGICGHLDALKLLVSKGYYIRKDTIMMSKVHKHLHVTEWLVENYDVVSDKIFLIPK